MTKLPPTARLDNLRKDAEQPPLRHVRRGSHRRHHHLDRRDDESAHSQRCLSCRHCGPRFSYHFRFAVDEPMHAMSGRPSPFKSEMAHDAAAMLLSSTTLVQAGPQ